MTTSQEAAKLKNHEIKIPSFLFRPRVQHLGSNKRWGLSPSTTYVLCTEGRQVKRNRLLIWYWLGETCKRW